MKICFVSYEYAPFPGGGIATYHNAAARLLAEAGHEVHVVTNRAGHGRREPQLTQRLWKEGNLTIHRIQYFDEQRVPALGVQFFDVTPTHYSGERWRHWVADPSNIAAQKAAAYIETLHREVNLDVIEAPEFFAEAFYVLRRRHSGWRHFFPPVCIHGHISSRIAFAANRHVWELGFSPHRYSMLREEYSITHADALITPSQALMRRYEALFPGKLPDIRATIPYYLEVPGEAGVPPPELEAIGRYLLCIGRVEPRKGSHLAMRAFGRLADDDPELRLVLLGKPMWHQGESIDDVIRANVPPQHRDRVLQLGNVSREAALAAAQRATVFLHPVPWDNYPCAVLEAMAMGAACVVSDQGGQSEMVEHERSGLVFPADDDAALTQAAQRMLKEPEFAAEMRRGAVARVQSITDPKALTERKIEVFTAMAKREAEVPKPPLGPFSMPAHLTPGQKLPNLPGDGLVIFDIAGADSKWVSAGRDMLLQELESSPAPQWSLAVLQDPGQEADLSDAWTRLTTIDRPPWLDLPPSHSVVWVRAGVRFERGALRHLVTQIHDAPLPCGSFAWLRPATPLVFPYASDFSWLDLLHGGHLLPQTFAVRAEHLRHCETLSGLFRPEHRICALLAAAAATGDMLFQHVGEIIGDWYADQPFVTTDTQERAAGYLDLHGLLPRRWCAFGQVHLPEAATPEQENNHRPMPSQDDRIRGSVNGRLIAPERLEELERVYKEHMTLKGMTVVRLLRRAKAFEVARRFWPKSKHFLGRGR
ncbi:MAG: glycosyltransferase family 4 protein [Planctomycetota bacterium]